MSMFGSGLSDNVYNSSGSSSSSNTLFKPEQIPIKGLALGTLLGKGGYGRVYRGIYRGQQVAVKVCFFSSHSILTATKASRFIAALPCLEGKRGGGGVAMTVFGRFY